jgi:hypothetical protein
MSAPKASAGRHFPACPRRLRSTTGGGWFAASRLLGGEAGKAAVQVAAALRRQRLAVPCAPADCGLTRLRSGRDKHRNAGGIVGDPGMMATVADGAPDTGCRAMIWFIGSVLLPARSASIPPSAVKAQCMLPLPHNALAGNTLSSGRKIATIRAVNYLIPIAFVRGVGTLACEATCACVRSASVARGWSERLSLACLWKGLVSEQALFHCG